MGRKPYNLLDPAHVSWVGSVLHRSCTTSQNGRLVGSKYFVDDLSDLSDVLNACNLSYCGFALISCGLLWFAIAVFGQVGA